MSDKKLKKITYFIVVSLLLLGFAPDVSKAFNLDDLMAEYEETYYYDSGDDQGDADIINNIKTSATSGGNGSPNAAIQEGASRAEIKVKTEINGVTVTDINLKKSAEANIDLKIENRLEADDGQAGIETVSEVNSETERETEVIDLGKAANSEIVSSPALSVNGNKPEESAASGLCSLEKNDCQAADNKTEGGFVAAWRNFFGALRDGILKIFNF